MATHTTSRYYVYSWAGLVFAGIAGIAATSIIVQDAFPNGAADWSHAKLEHALAPVLVAITAFLWLHAAREMKEGKLVALPLALVATFCSGLIVFESMGRGAEALDTKIAAATKTVDQYASIAADYEATKKLVKQSEAWVATACADGVGKNCRGQTFTLNQRKASADKLKADLEHATAPVPVDARGDRVAYLAGLMGYDGVVAKKAAQSLYPLARPLAFEFVMILLLHASVRTRKVSVRVSESVPVEVPAETPKALSFERPDGAYTDDEIEQIKKALNGMDRPVTNDELAALLGCSKSESSKRWRRGAEAGVVQAQRSGRYVHLRLVDKAA